MTDARIPVLVAVAGHRDPRPEDEAQLRAGLSRAFAEIARIAPHAPLLVLSGLAEGADRLAAEVALEMKLGLAAALPMPRADYAADFSGESLAAFDALMQRAGHVVEVPILAGQTRETIRSGEARNAQYDALAVYLAETAHVVVALWDGVRNEKPGGTGRFVDYRLAGKSSGGGARSGPPVPLHPGLTIRIAMPRASGAAAPDLPAGELRLLKRSGARTDELALGPEADADADVALSRRLIENHDRYNADVAAFGAVTQKYSLLDAAILAGDRALGPLAARYDAADALAVKYRDWSHFWLKGFIALALAAFACFEVFAHFFESNWILAGYLGVLGGSWALYTWLKWRQQPQERYLDYRALAEALRVQFYWRVAGIRDSIADHYLARQTDELAWVRQAARAAGFASPAGAPRADALKLIETQWIDDQLKFFLARVKSEGQVLRNRELWMRVAYGAGILVSAALLGAGVYLGDLHKLNKDVLHGIIVLMAVMPAVTATIGYYIEARAYAAHERRYAQMAHVFTWAKSELGAAAAADPAAMIEMLKSLGREALAENGDWLILHRERPVKPPAH